MNENNFGSLKTESFGEKLKTNFNNNKPVWIVGALLILAIVALVAPLKKDGEREALVVEGCSAGFEFNTITGEPCPKEIVTATPEGCEPGYKYSVVSGVPCETEVVEESDIEILVPEREVRGDDEDLAPVSSDTSASSQNVPAPFPSFQNSSKVGVTANSKWPSLADALVQYSGKTIKISKGCAISPAGANFAKGTRIMVHSDSTATHSIKIGGESFRLSPYRYKTVLLSASGNTPLSCDGEVVSTIVVR